MENIVKTNAQLEAEADSISATKEEDPREEETNTTFIIPLRETYNNREKSIDSVDLSRLEKLTTIDAQEVDKVVDAMNWHPRNKFRDTIYLKHVAMRATELPVEFFNMLNWKDMNNICARETLYFLFDQAAQTTLQKI